MLWHSGLANPGDTAPCRASQFQETVRAHLQAGPSYADQCTQIPCPSHPLYGALTLGMLFPALDTPGTRQLQTERPEIIQISPILKLPTEPSLFLPVETTIKTLVHFDPSLPLPPNWPRCFPVWPPVVCCVLLSGSVSHKLYLQWLSSPDPLASPATSIRIL